MTHEHNWNHWLPCDECGELHIKECSICGVQEEEED